MFSNQITRYGLASVLPEYKLYKEVILFAVPYCKIK